MASVPTSFSRATAPAMQRPHATALSRLITTFNSQRPAIGLSIVMGGQPIAWGIRGAVSEGQSPVFPALAVVVGLMLMVQPHWLWERRLYCPPQAVALPILGLLLPMALLSLTFPAALLFYGAYAAFLIPVTLAIALNPIGGFKHFVPWMLAVGAVSTVLPIVQLVVFGAQEGFYRLAVVGNENPLILATIAAITTLAAATQFATVRSSSFLVGAAFATLMAISIGVVVMTNTRSALIGLMLCFLVLPFLLAKRVRPEGRRSYRKLVGFVAVLVGAAVAAPIVFTAVLGTEATQIFAERTWDRIYGTFLTFFGDDLQVDASSLGRITIIEETLLGLSVFGKGMMAQELVMGQGYYPHLTYLHAFYDLGILGGLGFFLIAFAIPAALLWRRYLAGDLDPITIFVMLLFIYHQLDHLTHGAPYSWTLLVPSLLAYVLIWRLPAGMSLPLSFGWRSSKSDIAS